MNGLLLAFAFVASALLFGFLASLFIREKATWFERLAIAPAVGWLAASWLALLLSWFVFSELSESVVYLSTLLLLAASLFIGVRFEKKVEDALKADWFDSRKFALVLLFLIVFISFLHFRAYLEPHEDGSLHSFLNVWGDGPFHFSLITNFAFTDNFPPRYPLLDVPLGYPFLIDFSSAVLVTAGLGLREAVLVPNLLFVFALVSLIYFFTRDFTKSKLAGVIVILLFLFNGNAGLLYFIDDYQGGTAFPIAKDYSHLTVNHEELHFMNFIDSTFLPQRSALMGMAIALLVLWLLLDFDKQRKEVLIIAGVLAGLLPFVHGHSFIALCLALGVLFLFKPEKKWLWFFVPLVLLAVPQVLWTSQQTGGGFFGLQYGWMEQNSKLNLFELAVFWLRNAWVPLALGIAGLFALPRDKKVFAIPFLLLFVFGNLFRFQPQPWDSIKVLLYAFFFLCVLTALFLTEFLKRFKNAHWVKAIVVLVVLLSTASGLLSVYWIAWGDNARHQEYTVEDVALAEWVKQNTPPDSVFLCGSAHNHPIPSLAGRRVVMGYQGWLWSHGLSYGVVDRDARFIAETADCAKATEYGVDYVFIGPWETYWGDLKFNVDAFKQNPSFELVKQGKVDGFDYWLFKNNC
ncbi:MAG: hypothetical protein V1834_00830 [Candidatus Micrarchaeota archaeon]